MRAIDRLLDAAKAKTVPGNDSAVAEHIGVSRSAVSVWRRGGVITEKHLAELVKLAGVDASLAVQVLREQATTDAQAEVWGEVWGRLLHLMSTIRATLTGRPRAPQEPRAPH